MRNFWRAANISIVAFCTWSGYWATAPERAHESGFIRSVVPVGPGTPPIWISSAIVFVMFGAQAFMTVRRASYAGSAFRLPSWDRSPFRHVADPLQALVVETTALVCGTLAATVRFIFGPSLGLGSVMFLWSWDVGILAGAVVGYIVYRPPFQRI